MVTIYEFQRAGKSVYWFSFSGHTGYIKEASRRTPGVSVMRGSWGNGQAGGSNRSDLEIAQPSQDLYQQFVGNYDAVCQEMAEKKKRERELAQDIYAGRVDQLSTEEIAVQYHLKHNETLQYLKKIASGKVRQAAYPFQYAEERQGVRIESGKVFTYSPVDVDGKGMSSSHLKHYIWFCS